ncbi:prephenate dehydrogenase [Corchorus capsularis]|uniref:Prephenate dehydrogenase n=1 Tax=Corchorus capsularis TaxID=210143 RepID=A0A1R3GNQ2_COCAP|nr:prephenate dehydrogenase [Corchorus capsularis]
MEKDALRAKIKADMNKKKPESQDKGQGKKRLAEQLPSKDPKDNVSKKSKTTPETHSVASESLAVAPSSKPDPTAGGSGGTSKATSPKDTPSRGDRPLVGRDGVHTKHSAIPPKGRGRGTLDFLCDSMAHLKLGEVREFDAIEKLEQDECADCLVTHAHKTAMFANQLLHFFRPSLVKKDRALVESLDDGCLLMTRRECHGLQNKVDREKKVKEDALKLHGISQKKFNDLEAKFGKLEKDNSALTSQFATLKRSKDEEAGTFEVFKIQLQREIDDLKVFYSPFLWCFRL